LPVIEKERHARFIRAALTQAKKGIGFTSPNPAVGALLVRGKRIVAAGFHCGPGSIHAEVACLEKLPEIGRQDVLYVTLEPCSTEGRTGACVDYLIRRGVRRVVVGTTDPNPRHAGRGIDLLRKAGLEVVSGILEDECSRLNEAFNKWIVTGEPFVIAKCGMSLDGRLTRPEGESRWLTSAQARAHALRLRAQVDAVLVGAETIRKDNPQLTTRIGRRSPQPWRVILTRSGRLPRDARVFRDAHRHRTLVYRKRSLPAVLRELGRREITSVVIEGGGQVLSEALDRRLIDRIEVYLAPILTGGDVLAFAGTGAGSTLDSLRVAQVEYKRIGGDICISGYPRLASNFGE
jgi:diaminohydroxyphosphoribosylaminopyrimidine deaminase/5-amino-6-(5-phosphoribosylamino)uracil reductase